MRKLSLIAILPVVVLFLISENIWVHWVGFGLAVTGLVWFSLTKPEPRKDQSGAKETSQEDRQLARALGYHAQL